MSLEPMSVGAGRKLASATAGFCSIALAGAAFMTAAGVMLWLFMSGDVDVLLASGLVAVVVTVALGQTLVRLALGPHRTGGGMRRYGRYQLGTIGLGVVFGVIGLPLMTLSDAAPLLTGPFEWVACSAVAAIIGVASALCFRPDRRRPGCVPPRPGQVIVPGVVAEHWSAPSRLMTFDISVIRYTGPDGQERYVRHLYRQALTIKGVVGEVHVEVGRPDRATAFWVLSTRDWISNLQSELSVLAGEPGE